MFFSSNLNAYRLKCKRNIGFPLKNFLVVLLIILIRNQIEFYEIFWHQMQRFLDQLNMSIQ
ncbi:hypothetical protein pb186bvf_011888 [Paramecium bursaria]